MRMMTAFRGFRKRMSQWALPHVVDRPVLASLYYALLDSALSREGAAVAAGRLRYERDTQSDAASYFLLRRNIHRLEKGLIMRPRRPVFALDYLSETISIYDRAVRHAAASTSEELRWAHDVLAGYFAAVDVTHAEIAPSFERFNLIPRYDDELLGKRVPYSRKLDTASPVNFDNFMDLSMRRRSVRWYEDRPVPRDMVDRAIRAAAQAPSACNRQPFVYRIFDDIERARKLAAIPLGTKGFSDSLPGVIVLVGRLRAYPLARDRHAIYIDAALSAMAFMYALETMGLSSCPINWPDAEPQESRMARELDLDPDERVIMLIAYGWPDKSGMVPYSAKREIKHIRSFN